MLFPGKGEIHMHLPDALTIRDMFLGNLDLQLTIDFCLRLLLSCICGGAIGIERSRHFKEAGVRTHIIVCMGAALAMIVSKYGFADLVLDNGTYFPGTKETDPARVAAQVISGISFLGAGVIFKREGLVRGLTTAAGIWITAAIGLAVGSGMLVVGLFTAIVVCVLQILMHKFIFGPDAYATNQLHFTVKNGYDFNHALNLQLEAWNGLPSMRRSSPPPTARPRNNPACRSRARCRDHPAQQYKKSEASRIRERLRSFLS